MKGVARRIPGARSEGGGFVVSDPDGIRISLVPEAPSQPD